MNKLTLGLILLALVAGLYWLGASLSWWGSNVPRNLPTAKERERIEAVEEARLQEAPNAKAGIQVREPGSTPAPAPAVEPTATTTGSTTPEATQP